jgi:protein-L-isoaspartate(D-aspartate) O-methyltransferase
MSTLEDYRRFYAEEVQVSARLTSTALIEAFARVPRERFLGPGPWDIVLPDITTGRIDYMTTADSDPRRIYHNVVVALDRSRDLTNGQPVTLATYINALSLMPGDRVYHLGCGSGYYTAIMSEIVGPGGRVTASEVHQELGPAAQRNLADCRNVSVHTGDGMLFDPGECDAMLINAGVTHPLGLWLDRLPVGGRIVLPITTPMGPNLGKGVMLKITRQPAGSTTQLVSFVAIYSCTSMRDPKIEAQLGKAFGSGALMKVKSVRRDPHEPTETCAAHGDGICLSLSDLAPTTS